MSSAVAHGLLAVVCFFFIANGVARLAMPSNKSDFRISEMSSLARDELGAAKARERQLLIERASSVAAVVEVILAILILSQVRERLMILMLMIGLAAFSGALVLGALLEWPVSSCNCVAGINNMDLRLHLVLNGGVILLLAAVRSQRATLTPAAPTP